DIHGNAQVVARRLQANRILACFVGDGDARLIVRIVEGDGVTEARSDDALLDLAASHHVVVFSRRGVFAVPQSAEDVRVVNVTLLEADQDFVVYLRQELQSTLGTVAGRHDAGP